MRRPVPPGESTRRRFVRLFCRRPPSAAAWILLVPLTGLAGLTHAIGLGEVSEQSAFGTSLRVVVPVLAGPGEDVAGECVKLVSARQSDDGIPEVRNARTALERTSTGARIVVMSPRAVADPVLKLTLQVGCENAVRREYVLLLDPLPIDIPVAQEGSGLRAPAATLVPETARVAAGDGSMAGAASAKAAAPPPRAAARRRATTAASAPKAGATPRDNTAQKSGAATVRAAPKAAAAPAPRPKLTVSTEVPVVEAAVPSKGAAGTVPAGSMPAAGARAAASPQTDSSAALDAQAAALQQRVAELTGMVDKMQQEMRATEALQAAQSARIAAENAAKSSPRATIGRWWNDNWPLLVGVVVLAALIAAVLSSRRRRATVAGGPWRLETTSQRGAQPPQHMPSPAPADALPQSVAASSPGPQAATPPAAATAVHVSELAHVTEEAGVYLAFNRRDRAIEVLREHIGATPQSLPSAWLMLLDLYHAQGSEPEFRALAEKFHAQFNAQTPAWDAYRPLAQSDRGLEAFPHLVEKLVKTWGKPECRGFLDDLLHENRDGRRTGFSITAYEDIIFLRQLADSLSGDSRAVRPVPLPPRARAAAPPSAAALAAAARRPPTLDLELALDEDMLDAGKSASAAPSAARPAKEPPRKG